jgi:hypothetical protein
MTLVLSCITPSFVVQVSDRRLTKLDGSLADDETNKAVLFLGHFVFSYTGLAYVGQTRTDRWLVERLGRAFQQSKPNAGAAIATITTEASQAFQRIPGRERKRHEFVAVGWGAFWAEQDRLRPSILRLSNALDEAGNWLPQAKRHFELVPTFLHDEEQFRFLASGQEISEPGRRWPASRCASGTAGSGPGGGHGRGQGPARGRGPGHRQPRRRGRAAPWRPGRPRGLSAGSCGVTRGRALAAQRAVAALAGPVDRPQPLGRGRVLAAPLVGRPGGGALAGPAVGRQPPAPAAVELAGLPDPAAPRAALARTHAAAPPGRLPRRALAEARARRVK